jgi:hypothetical protein
MFYVEVISKGAKFWLGGTVWRFSAERASMFGSEAEAKAALEKAKKFMPAATFKAARVVPVTA